MRILVIRYSSLGDVVLAGAVPRAIARRHPKAEISFLTKSAYQTIAAHFDAPVDIVPIDAFHPLRSSLSALRRRRFDWIVDLHASPRSVIVSKGISHAHLSRVKKHTKRRGQMVKQKEGLDKPLSVLSNYCDAAKPLGIDEEECVPRLILTEDEAREAKRLRTERPDALGIGWGARWPTKAIPDSLLHAILDTAIERATGPALTSVRLFGMASEQDAMRTFASTIRESHSQLTVDCHVELTDTALMTHLAACAVYLGPDSGLTHLANALQVPTVTLFGPTHPALGFAPTGPSARVFHAGTWCSPCHKHGADPCFRDSLYCFEELAPDAIAGSVLELLSQPESH